jgi:hypothetical protein
VSELGGVAHLDLAVDRVAVSAADAFAFDESRVDEVGEDSLGGAFGDPDVVGDVAEPDVGFAGDAEEDLGVVGDEAPAAVGLFLSRYRRSQYRIFSVADQVTSFIYRVIRSGD